jgi:hypothetical protein
LRMQYEMGGSEMAKKRDFDGLDNNHQRDKKVRGGEKRNGRLSQFKNDRDAGSPYQDQYLDSRED